MEHFVWLVLIVAREREDFWIVVPTNRLAVMSFQQDYSRKEGERNKTCERNNKRHDARTHSTLLPLTNLVRYSENALDYLDIAEREMQVLVVSALEDEICRTQAPREAEFWAAL